MSDQNNSSAPTALSMLSGALNHARDALRFYAEQDHFVRYQPDEWDTVSGEPQNLYEDSAHTATVEDGSVAKQALEDIAAAESYASAATQPPAERAPSSVQDGQGGLTEVADALEKLEAYCAGFYENAKVRGAEAAHRRADEMAKLARAARAILARQSTLGSAPQAVPHSTFVAQEFLNWNRSQEKPPVAIGKELGIARKVLELAAAPQEQAASRAAVPEGFVLMPKALTAENGAKAALSGEFRETIQADCPACCGDGEDCNECGGTGTLPHSVPVGWSNIKAIYARAVELLAAAPAAQKGKAVDGQSVKPEPLNGIPATMRHDEGAIACCSYCGRYSLDPKTLSDRQPECECGKRHGWSGSFKRPGPDARWSGKAPAAQQDSSPAHRPCTMRMSQGADVVEVTGRGDGQQDSGQKITDPLCAEFNCLLHAEPGKKLCCNHEQDSGQKGGAA